MAGGKTTYQAGVVLGDALGDAGTYSPPASWFVALSTAPFDPDATGIAMDEVAAPSYARIEVTNDTTNFPAPAGSQPVVVTLATDVLFAEAAEDWGTIQAAYLCDALTDGNACYGSDSVIPIPVPTGGQPFIPGGTWTFQEL